MAGTRINFLTTRLLSKLGRSCYQPPLVQFSPCVHRICSDQNYWTQNFMMKHMLKINMHTTCNSCTTNSFHTFTCNRTVLCSNTSHEENSHKTQTIYDLCSSKSVYSNSKKENVTKTTSQLKSQQISSVRRISVSPKDLLEASPSSFQPYLRLIRFDKPIGTWLLYWPCTWSISLAAFPGHLPDFKMLALFGLGAFFMRGAGCIINDLWDKDFDKKVFRTRNRPLASGELSNIQALSFLGIQLSASLAILLQLNWYSVFLGASSMGLVLAYPLAKRYTYWPQFVLGITLNWGVLLGWSAIHGALEWPVIPLYTACVLYTVIYDTIYSHQDKEDDILVGVKSTALKFGDQTKYWLTGFSSLMLSGLLLTGHMCEQTWPYYTGLGVVGAHLAYQIYSVDLSNPKDCFTKFRANSHLGILLFLGIVAGTLMKEKNNHL